MRVIKWWDVLLKLNLRKNIIKKEVGADLRLEIQVIEVIKWKNILIENLVESTIQGIEIKGLKKVEDQEAIVLIPKEVIEKDLSQTDFIIEEKIKVKINQEEDAKVVTKKRILFQAKVIALIHHQDSSQLMKND